MRKKRGFLAVSSAIVVAVLASQVFPVSAFADSATTTSTNFAVSTTLTAHLDASTTSTTLTLPTGMSASALSGQLTVGTGYPNAEVDVLIGSTNIATNTAVATISATKQGTYPVQASDLSSTLTSSTTDSGSQIVIGLRYRVATTDTTVVCESIPPDYTVTLSNIQLTLAGTATTPTTVAQFMTGPADQIIIVASDSSTSAVRQAALSAAAAAAKVWGGSGASVSIATSAPTGATPSYPSAIRVIQLNATTTGSTQQVTSVQGIPTLTLTGDGDALTAAAVALADSRLALATSSTTSSLSASASASTSLSNTKTLSDLGLGTAELSWLGPSETYLGIAQSTFGGAVSSLSIHLLGTESAIPAGIEATANAYWNDVLVDSFVLGQDTQIDRTISIDSSQMKASNSLRIVLSVAVTSSGSCASVIRGLPIELDLNTVSSTVTASFGQTLDAGFARFPQVLANHLQVAFDSGLSSDAALALAGRVVVALQEQQTSSVLGVQEISVSDAESSSGPVFVVGATSATAAALSAPLRLEEFRAIDSSTIPIGVDVDQAFFAVQAFQSGRRDVLLAGGWSANNDTSQLDSLAGIVGSSLAQATYGWSSWSNDLVFVGGGTDQQVVNLNTKSLVPQTQVTDEYRPLAWWLVGGVAVLILAIIIGIWVRRRRLHQKAKAYVATESGATPKKSGGEHDNSGAI